MWYTVEYANILICTPAHGGRAGHPGDRSPVDVRLDCASLPDPPRQCRAATDDHDCTRSALPRSDRTPHHSCVSSARPRGAAAPVVATADHDGDVHPWGLRGPAGTVAPESPHVRQAHQPLDADTGRRGECCRGADPTAGQRRSHSCGPPPLAGVLEAGPTLDHQSRSRICPKKNGATRGSSGPGPSPRGRWAVETKSGGAGWLSPTNMPGQRQTPNRSCRS
jgi:hypothetical protein